MPELPEVETVCQALKPVLEGQSFREVQLNREGLRYPFTKDLSDNLTRSSITQVTRRAKYLLIHFEHGQTLVWHLGMSGCIIIESSINIPQEVGRHDHVLLTTSTNIRITYRDPRRFGFLMIKPSDQIQNLSPFNTLGPEPLDELALTGNIFHASLSRRATPLKNALLDQNLIAGLGNIYVSEALWRAKLSPLRLANTLSVNEASLLLREIRNVLKEAIAAGGSTLRDHKQPDGNIGYFQHSFKVYNRHSKKCGHCNKALIIKIVQSGRSTYYCPYCQK